MNQPVFTIEDHSGGMNRFVQPFLLAPNEQIETINMVATEFGGLALRKAINPSVYHRINDDKIGAGRTVHSAELLTKYNGDQFIVSVLDNGVVNYAKVGNSISDPSLTLSGSFTDSCMFLDTMFLVSLYDTTRSFNGTDFSTSTNVTGAPKGKFVEQYKAKVYIANCNVSGTSYPNRIVYSDLPSEDTIAWDNGNNYVDVERDDGDKIMGMKKFGERLVIFKEYSMYRYDESSVYKVVGAPGTVSHRSIESIDQALIYLAHDGIRVYDGGKSHLKSRAIQPYIDAISDHGKYYSFSWVDGSTYNIFVGDLTNQDYDIDIKDAVISYDIYTHEFRTYSFRNDDVTYPFFDSISVSNVSTDLTTTSTSTTTSTTSTSTSTTSTTTTMSSSTSTSTTTTSSSTTTTSTSTTSTSTTTTSTSTTTTSTTTTTTSTTTSTTLPYVTYDSKKHFIAGYLGLYNLNNGYNERDSANESITYSGEILYPHVYPTNPETINTFDRANIYLSRAGNIKAKYRIDENEWIDINTQVTGKDNVVSLKFNTKRGRGIQFWIETMSGAEPPVIRRLAIFLKPEGQQ